MHLTSYQRIPLPKFSGQALTDKLVIAWTLINEAEASSWVVDLKPVFTQCSVGLSTSPPTERFGKSFQAFGITESSSVAFQILVGMLLLENLRTSTFGFDLYANIFMQNVVEFRPLVCNGVWSSIRLHLKVDFYCRAIQ